MIDTQRITDAVCATNASPLALESGAELVDYWIAQGICADKKIVAIECGFVLWLDSATAVIGVQDLLTEEEGSVTGNEWKTTKEQTKYWNEDKWFEEISSGSQVAIYALALQHGLYYEKGTTVQIHPAVANPCIRVRAISKSSPPVIWPTDGDGIVTFTQERLNITRNALWAKAASIRAMRASKAIPWQLQGLWCENKFRRKCEYFDACAKGDYPQGYEHFDSSDPAFTLALGHIDFSDPATKDIVVLGASAYSAVCECPEKYRRNTLGGGKEQSLALDTGSVFHQGVACYYSQIRENQLTSTEL